MSGSKSNSIISAHGVTRILPGTVPVTLVKDIDLEIGHGEFVAITGPSGSGKSSLLYLLGLRLETDWPEGIGALIVAASIATGELMVGWEKFELGGMAVIPYVIPLVVFLVMMAYSVARSR